MSESLIFQQLGLSLLLGMLVGLQRERTQGRIAIGVRTFPMVTVFGTVCAQISMVPGNNWVIFSGMIALTIVMIVPHFLNAVVLLREKPPELLTDKDGLPINESGNNVLTTQENEFGITTQVSALLMFGVGVLMVLSHKSVAVAIAGAVAILLQSKIELHRFAHRLSETDMKAIMQFVLITCIILPILPNQTYGPYGVFNPVVTWMMVVLIVGMGLLGYIAYMFLGRDSGILLGGFLGGAISSTATTVSYSRQAKISEIHAAVSPIVIMIASTVAFVRVLVEITVISRAFLEICLVPVLILMGLTLIPAILLYFRIRQNPTQMPIQENPTHLRSAITFAIVFTIVSFTLAATKELIGQGGLYVVAAFSGITDMDAITLSTSRLATLDPSIMHDGWRLIVIGALSNLVSKAVIVALIAGRVLLKQILILFAIPFLGGILMLLLL